MLKAEAIEWVGTPKTDSWDNRKNIGIPFKIKEDKRTFYLDGFNIFDSGECTYTFFVFEYSGDDEEIFKVERQTTMNLSPSEYEDIEGINSFVSALLHTSNVRKHIDWFKSK